jgi:hypothetical protein
LENINFKLVLRYCVFFIFVGRAYQFFFFGAPFRSVLWDESLFSPVVEGIFNVSWYEYSTNLKVNSWIETFTHFCGLLFLCSGLTVLFWKKLRNVRLKRFVLKLGIVLLFVLTLLIFKSKNFRMLEVFEMFIQLSLPIALLKLKNDNKEKVSLFLKVAIALTFTAHGLYAMGIPFRPGHFIDMTIGITGMTEPEAVLFLTIAGVLDILASLLLFSKYTFKYALSYIFIWGLLTALARVVYGFNSSFILNSLHESLYTTIYRLPHGLIALVIFLLLYSSFKFTEKTTHEK